MEHKIHVKDNPYSQVYVDLTYKCNMKCNTCYNPWVNRPDLDLAYFEDVCAMMPRKVWFRFIGGEPTVSNKLRDAMRIAKKYHHPVSVVTNGVRFADYEYAKEFKSWKIPAVIALSWDGGYHDEFYAVINGKSCSHIKAKAIGNMEELGYKRVVLTVTLIRGLNEIVIPEAYYMSQEYNCIKYIHYRSQVQCGNWVEDTPYNMHELEQLVRLHIPEWDNPQRWVRDGITYKGQKCQNCCKCAWVKGDLQITLIDANSNRIKNCHMRGKLNNDYTVTSFFESIYDMESEEIKC